MKCYNCESKKLVCDNTIDAYVCQDCGYEHYKQYFFISHSHQDIEKVRVLYFDLALRKWVTAVMITENGQTQVTQTL